MARAEGDLGASSAPLFIVAGGVLLRLLLRCGEC
jgi:hypothetical protein